MYTTVVKVPSRTQHWSRFFYNTTLVKHWLASQQLRKIALTVRQPPNQNMCAQLVLEISVSPCTGKSIARKKVSAELNS